VDRSTRKKLKKDEFARDVGLTVEYLTEHRKQAIRYGLAGAVVLLLVLGVIAYRSRQHATRQAALKAASDIIQAPIGPPTGEPVQFFPTEAARNSAAIKAFADVVTKYRGSDEATIAEYYLGTAAAGQGKTPEAEKWLKSAAETGNANYASLAKLSLADVYRWEGKTPEAEKLLRSLIAKPTEFVSKEHATIALAELFASSKPDEARKLLTSLGSSGRPAIGRAVMNVMNELPRPH
jgi:predicted negative regulator of RcsB-dependent stress response